MDDKQGRCWTCKLVFLWHGKPRVRDAWCPRCSDKLHHTRLSVRQGKLQRVVQKPRTVESFTEDYCGPAEK